MGLLRAVRESSRKLMLFHCLHQHYKARSNRGNVPSASKLGNRINKVPARKMSLGENVLAVIQQLSRLTMASVSSLVFEVHHFAFFIRLTRHKILLVPFNR